MIKLFFSYLLGGVATGLLDVVTTMLVTRMISPEAYGQGMWFISLINILFCFCVIGMDQVFVRFFYETSYKKNLSLLFYRCLLLVFPCVAVVSIFLFCFWDDVMRWLKIDSTMIIPFFIIDMILITLIRFLRLMTTLKERTTVYNLANFFEKLCSLVVFVIVFYFFTTGYWAIMMSQIISVAMLVLGLLLIYRKELVLPSRQWGELFEIKETKAFLKFGTPSIFSLGLHLLFLNVDKFFILQWSTYQELGIYTAAFALIGPLVLMESIFTTAWVPRLNHLLIHNPFKAKLTLSVTFEKLNFAMISLILILILFKDELLLFIGPDFKQAGEVFPWLLFVPYFWALSEIVVAGVVKSKKSYWHIYFSGSALGVNILGCYLLIPLYGAIGAAISVATSFGVFFLVRWHIAFRYYPFRINPFKLIPYVGFTCVYIVSSQYGILKYLLFLPFICIAIILERKWLVQDLFSVINALSSKFVVDSDGLCAKPVAEYRP